MNRPCETQCKPHQKENEMTVTCIFCNATSHRLKSVKDAKVGKPISIATCQACGLVQLAKVPKSGELAEFYRSDYRLTYRKSDAPKPKHVLRAGLVAAARVRKLAPHVKQGAKLLDVGAGGGEFVYLAGQAGFDAAGIDPASGYLAFGRENYGVSLSDSGLEATPPQERYDVITMFHVLEHLADPKAALQQVYDRLNPDGIFFVEVPNLGSASASPFNQFFEAHITYFTQNSLGLIVDPLFETLAVRDSRVLQMILRKRPMAVESTKDRADSVARSNARMEKLGLVEYLTHGGLLSPIRTARRMLAEAKAKKYPNARAILDDLK